MMKKEVIIFVIIILFLSPKVSAAFGVSPPSVRANFHPYLTQTFVFNFLGDGGVASRVYAQGDLAKYVKLDTEKIVGSDTVTVNLQLPKAIDTPGDHIIYIGAAQQANNPSGFSLVGNIRAMIIISVPYPEKYALVSLTTSDAKSGQPVNFRINIASLGTEEIAADTVLRVYDSAKRLVAAIQFDPIQVAPTKSIDLIAQLNTTENQAGFYEANATVNYGGKRPAEAIAGFRLGELYVNLTSYSNDLDRNKINKLDLHVESLWNDPIQDVYADVSIPDYAINFKTPSINLDGFGSNTLTGYFDTTGIPKEIDEFNAKILLHYEGKITEKAIVLRFKKETNYLIYELIAGVILAIIILITVIIIHKKLQKTKRGRFKK